MFKIKLKKKEKIDKFELKDIMNESISLNDKTSAELLQIWRTIKDKMAEIKKLNDPYDDMRKKIEKAVYHSLEIPEGKLESEKVSLKGAGYCKKETIPGIKVHDWDGFKRWMVENNWTALSRNQANNTPIAELDQAILKNKIFLPPEIAEIIPYDKLTIAKGRN